MAKRRRTSKGRSPTTDARSGEGPGLRRTPALLVAPIHRSAWKGRSRKFGCRVSLAGSFLRPPLGARSHAPRPRRPAPGCPSGNTPRRYYASLRTWPIGPGPYGPGLRRDPPRRGDERYRYFPGPFSSPFGRCGLAPLSRMMFTGRVKGGHRTDPLAPPAGPSLAFPCPPSGRAVPSRTASRPSLCPYSTNLVEGQFSELRYPKQRLSGPKVSPSGGYDGAPASGHLRGYSGMVRGSSHLLFPRPTTGKGGALEAHT